MSFPNWVLKPATVFAASHVMPVMVIHDLDRAIPLAKALFAGGIHVLEVTLRTAVALDAVHLLTQTFPEALIGVGTVTSPVQLNQAIDAGAKFAMSPGQTQALLQAGCESNIPLIPGIGTVSDLMEGLAWGYTHFKLFPAEVVGGIKMLRAMYQPFPQAQFCPTGGINEGNVCDYLALPNVACVGGSWIVPDQAIKQGNWSLITDLCLSLRDKLIKI